ncbi:MAG: hypothetical protein KC454_12140 [Flavobacteriales bacterium]|nr:hypothetical protein [Flavobacteriales bacterium]
MHSFIKWQYISINDYEVQGFLIDTTPTNLKHANQEFQLDYPELHEVLFESVAPNRLKLLFPKNHYLGTDSTGETDMILRKFLEDDSDNSKEDVKPIVLSRNPYPLRAYELFSQLLGNNCFPANNNYGILELGFNDTNGHVCSNGEEAHEISITISEKGIKWSWWPNE